MATILGIDAAWTAGEPSGVALVQGSGTNWRSLAVAPSYEAFIGLACGVQVDWSRPARGAEAGVRHLLGAARALAGEEMTLIAVDMPVATTPIVGRRAADRQVSQEFGGRWCSAHSPSPIRPGPVGARLTQAMWDAGYPVATAETPVGTPLHLVEVYPHPALLSLLHRDRRVPYKVSKASKYWRNATVAERIQGLLVEFAEITAGLATQISGPLVPLPRVASTETISALKPAEDGLDALVCCWVGMMYCNQVARPLGDATCAIWCPTEEQAGDLGPPTTR